MCDVFPFSHKMREYMLKTLTPSCFLVRNFRPEGELPVSTVVRREGPGVLDREIAESGLGVRERDDGGEWKA